jgi:Holliday junction DNA helicase RuvA
MIGYLKGRIKFIGDGYVILDVSNVGYKVEISNEAVVEGEEKEYFIYTHVRENDISLYGFEDNKLLRVFELLLDVSGVGPKSAIRLVSDKTADKILSAIAADNPQGLKVKGIGKKTAEKIILELKNKIDQFKYIDSTDAINNVNQDVYMDVIEALSSLGYRKREIDKAFEDIEIDEDQATGEIVKQILSYLKN